MNLAERNPAEEAWRKSAAACLAEYKNNFRPRTALSVADWAEENRVLTVESGAAGRYNVSTTPWMRLPMDCVGEDHPAEYIVFIKPAQSGGTEGMINAMGCIAAMWPSPMIYALSKQDLLTSMVHSRIFPMFMNTKALRDRITFKRDSVGSAATSKTIPFPGGRLWMVSARSGSSLRGQSARVVFADEVDGWPASLPGGEGDPLELLINRTIKFGETRKIFIASTPKGGFDSSRVYRNYMETNRCLFFIPCPECDAFQNLEFERLIWTNGDPASARYSCSECDAMWTDDDKNSVMHRGEWRPTMERKDNKRWGFWLNQLYSPPGWQSFRDLADKFEKAENNPERMAAFVNTALATPFDHTEFQPSLEAVKNQVELPAGATCPEEVNVITAGMDVHNERTEMYCYGWSSSKEIPWALDRVIFNGSMNDEKMHEMMINKIQSISFKKPSGIEMPVYLAAIDTGGHWTKNTYKFIERWYATERWLRGKGELPNSWTDIIGVKGNNQYHGDMVYKAKRNVSDLGVPDRPIDLFNVRTPAIKELLYKKMDEGQLVSLKRWREGNLEVSDKYYDEIRAEQMTQSTRSENIRFILPSGAANHALDCFVYAYAALKHIPPINWDETMQRQEAEAAAAIKKRDRIARGGRRKTAKGRKSSARVVK